MDSSEQPLCIRAIGDRRARTPLGSIWLCRLDHIPGGHLDELIGSLGDDERARAARFRFERDRRRFIVGRAWLRRVLAQQIGVPAVEITFEYGAWGKPRLAACQNTERLQFNLAHSNDLAALVITTDRETGIDVEHVRPLNDETELARTCFSSTEYADYLAVAETARTAAFFNGWTRKEAFIKGTGRGLSQPLDSFDVELAATATPRLTCRDGEFGADRWHLASFVPAPGFAAAVAIEVGYQITVSSSTTG